MSKARYAIYFSPETKSPLWRLGSCWLGRDSASGESMKRLSIKGIKDARIAEITATPRHYGFHATLKAPFYLAKDLDRQMLDESLEAFCAGHKPFKVPALHLNVLDDFIALYPVKKCQDLDDFAADCVRAFDIFRAPPTKEETKKRLGADLTAKQKKLLDKWGYPYVMDEYRFHMTLTERLKTKERMAVLEGLAEEVKDLSQDKAWTFDTITLVRQKNAKEMFKVLKSYTFSRASTSRWPTKIQK